MKIFIELKNDERNLWQLCASVFEMKVICLNKKSKLTYIELKFFMSEAVACYEIIE